MLYNIGVGLLLFSLGFAFWGLRTNAPAKYAFVPVAALVIGAIITYGSI